MAKNRNYLYGIAPVCQCLLNNRRNYHQLFIKSGSSSKRLKEIVRLAVGKNVPVKEVDTQKLVNLSKSKLHQAVVLECGELSTFELEEFLEIKFRSTKIFLIALDQIEDPQNVGAIIRSAAFLGADGVMTLKKHASPLSAAVSKASAGALEYFPVIQIPNLSESLQRLRKESFSIAGATVGDSSIDFTTFPVTDYSVLVLGNEGQGLRKLTQKRCDALVHIPGSDNTESLNVSAAAAILIHHFMNN